ncbi:30S ribosomal protein S12 methylthiotransferase RimO [Treponema sp. HNW]|uniref:30S ribosomal protein S12 methylthiotransferase RimO n=1 Tax=Treponema sp. HNW TaxID=3116654 RepID=UPI003D10D74A
MTESGTSLLRRFYLDQYGCAKNQVDGELIISYLEKRGYAYTEDAEKAGLIIINSCGFIESAKKESLDALFAARKAYPAAKIILAGCLSERYADVFEENLPEADAVFGNGDLNALGELLDKLEEGKRPVIKREQKGVCAGERTKLLGFPCSAYIKITEGCNNRCSFCAIPLIRGNLRSRSADDIVDEIRSLQKRGIFEFNLIGQDLAAYGCDGACNGNSEDPLYFQSPGPLSLLLQKISALEGDFWLRLLYIHPDHFPLDILPLIQKDKRIIPYFDLPFQSGDNRIIRAMNRRGTAESYTELIRRIKADLKDAVLRTTFLCGFPGETDEEAEHTLAFLKEIKPLWSGCFAYSAEEDTPAALIKKKIPAKTVEKRIAALQSAQEKITEELLHGYIGRVCDVLVEERIEDEETSFGLGRCRFQAPEADGICVIRFDPDAENAHSVFPGAVVKVRIDGVRGVDVVGVLSL